MRDCHSSSTDLAYDNITSSAATYDTALVRDSNKCNSSQRHLLVRHVRGEQIRPACNARLIMICLLGLIYCIISDLFQLCTCADLRYSDVTAVLLWNGQNRLVLPPCALSCTHTSNGSNTILFYCNAVLRVGSTAVARVTRPQFHALIKK